MLKISDFARIGQVSIFTLRYYDEIKLLQPVHVDPENGYRYYEVSQLARLHRILALKDVGFELAQIMLILDQEVSSEALQKMLHVKEIEVRNHIQQEQDRLAHIEARLKSLERGESMPTYEVILKSVKPMTVISTRDIVPTIMEKVRYANDLLDFIKQQRVKPVGPILYLYYEEEYTNVDMDIEVAIPVEHSSVGTLTAYRGERITVRALPAEELVACVLYHGSPYMIDSAFHSLGTWIEANGYSIIGVCRKIILSRCGGLDDSVIEIQFPVEKMR
jgi:DNA-binding transcriptional MerR regulator